MQVPSCSSPPSVFSFDSLDVRVVVRDGDPWFVANDVAAILGYTDCKQAIRDHCKCSELLKGVDSAPLTSSPRGITIIPERDVYRLIMRSKLPSAERFEEWVVGEVLPSIRKTGSFGSPVVPQTLPEALRLAADLAEQNSLLVHKIADIEPKAQIADRIHTSDGLFGFRQSAKILQMNENRLRDWLVQHDWVYYLGKRMTGKHYAIKHGYIVERVKLIQVVGEEDKSIKEMFFTSKGVHRLASVFSVELEVAA